MRRIRVMESRGNLPIGPLARAAGLGLVAVLALLWLTACNPTVRVAPPEEPIVINMNVKIEHEIHVKVDKELEEVFEDDPEIF